MRFRGCCNLWLWRDCYCRFCFQRNRVPNLKQATVVGLDEVLLSLHLDLICEIVSLERLPYDPSALGATLGVWCHHYQTFGADREQRIPSVSTYHFYTSERRFCDSIFDICANEIRLSEKICDIGRFRIAIHRLRGANLFERAFFHHTQPLGETQCFFLCMCDEHCADPFGFQERSDLLTGRLP